ncbi:hypothetical protein B0H11DRAFT_2282355 [Mycena galericulata]|nr:hypothetical protein B0H11DRAFT_2282355 [Mycena galericulata]
MISFPTELVEQVIDNLASDTLSIAACGLVCRQWTPRSRFHLFATQIDLHMGTVPGFRPGRGVDHIMALKKLVKSPLQTFAPFVIALNIMGPIEDIYLTLKELSALDNITTLTIECLGTRLSIPSQLEKVLRQIPPSFPHVRILQLLGGEFTLAQFASLACGFQELEILLLDPVRWTFEDSRRRDASNGIVLPQTLHTLEFSAGTGFYAVLPWIIAHNAPPAIHKLFLETTSISIKDFEGLRDVLRILGSSLRDLTLFFHTRDADAWWSKRKALYICKILTLSHNTALETLSCGASLATGLEIWLALISAFLPTLRAPELRTVTLRLEREGRILDAPYGPDLLEVPWGDLDELIYPLASIARLQILHDLFQEDEDVVRGSLPRCDARGVLFFKQEETNEGLDASV